MEKTLCHDFFSASNFLCRESFLKVDKSRTQGIRSLKRNLVVFEKQNNN